MMLGRRGFLKTILTLAAAPAIVRASSLMPVSTRKYLGDGLWVSLYTGAKPWDDIDSAREAAYTGYSRVSISRDDFEIVAGTARNKIPIVFPQCAGGLETISGFAILDALGRPLYSGKLANSISLARDVQFMFREQKLIIDAGR